MKNYQTNIVNISKTDAIVALRTVLNILDKWQCSAEEKYVLLGLPRSTYFKYLHAPKSAKIDVNLLERLSYLLNIHSALRILFNEPNSVYNWIRKPNKAPLFNNNSAIHKMLSGKIADLSDVSRYLNAQRGGWS
ncbi:MAG: DUF2384 domain-containing protein [Gammaproteobacteria bacterium]|nr:DUF2384 domain-containing protein [Gammaproteobacteria bacterium]